MKKLLWLLGAISLVATTSATVVACDTFNPGNGNGNGGKPDPEKPTQYQELSQNDESWDYVYNSKKQYQEASEYYLEQATTMYSLIEGLLNSENPPSENDLWYSFGDYYFQSVIWYANESQWDLVRIDEIDGNYKYDEIDPNLLTQDSYSKEWFKERQKSLKQFVDYYYGSAKEIQEAGKWGIYAGGMSKGLERYHAAKRNQIENPPIPGMTEGLENDLQFINNLTNFWEIRAGKIKALNDKITEILINWED